MSEAVSSALTVPLYEWPKELKKAAGSFRKGKVGKALSAIEKEGEAYAAVAASVQGLVEGRLAALESAASQGDWMTVENAGEALADAIKDRPEEEKVDALLDRLKESEPKAILKAQRNIARIFERNIKSKQYEGLKKKINKIAEEFPSCRAIQEDAERAQERLRRICKKK